MSFMEIFQPGLKFLREERERQRMNVAYPTDGADPLMEIDLDAGTATIVVPAQAAATAPATAPAATGPAVPSHSEQTGDATGSSAPDPSSDQAEHRTDTA